MSKLAKPLSNAEWKCLEGFGRAALSDAPKEQAGVAGGRDCSEAVLHSLASKGLIDLVPEIWLPLEMKRSVYRLTAAGKAILAARAKGTGPKKF